MAVLLLYSPLHGSLDHQAGFRHQLAVRTMLPYNILSDGVDLLYQALFVTTLIE